MGETLSSSGSHTNHLLQEILDATNANGQTEAANGTVLNQILTAIQALTPAPTPAPSPNPTPGPAPTPAPGS